MEGFRSELHDIEAQYDKIISEVREFTEPLSEEQFNWRPDETKWSIAECIDHLSVTANGYLPNIEKVIKASSESKAPAGQQIKFGIIGKIFRKLEPPPKNKIKAPKKLAPRKNLDKNTVLKEFFAVQEKIKELINKSIGLNINKLKVPSPVLSLIKVRIGEFYAFTAVHERRHIWQIKEILSSNDFPPSA
jgi:hypothetical protein